MSYMELFYPSVSQPTWVGSTYDSSYNQSYGRSYQSGSSMVLHVPMCCEKCVQKVRKALSNIDNVEAVDVDMDRQKVTITGYVNPERVLRKVRKVKKTATYWDSSHDYANYSTGAYDYQGRTSSSAYDYNGNYLGYSNHSPSSWEYSQSYNSSPASYGSSRSDYSRSGDIYGNHHRYSSYDAYRYL